MKQSRRRVNFFSQESTTTRPSKQKVVKEDRQLFTKLFISCQSRACDLQEFFQHENQPLDGGKLYTCQKSQLASILETGISSPDQEPKTDVIIIDGSALVHTLPRKDRDFWGLCSTGCSTHNTCLCHKVQDYTHCVWFVQSSKSKNGNKVQTRPG